MAGGLYAIFSLHNDGAAANAEIFFAPFVTVGFLLLFQNRKFSNIKVFLIGIILGIGMQIKYLVIMDTLALVLLGTWFGNEGRIRGRDGLIKNFQTAFKFYLILGIGLILPAIIIASIYQFYGYFDEYIYATLSANSKYVAMLDFSWSDLLLSLIHI